MPFPSTVPTFAAVRVEASPALVPTPSAHVSRDSGLLEIIFQDRVPLVRVRPGFDAPTLARVLDVLEARAC